MEFELEAIAVVGHGLPIGGRGGSSRGLNGRSVALEPKKRIGAGNAVRCSNQKHRGPNRLQTQGRGNGELGYALRTQEEPWDGDPERVRWNCGSRDVSAGALWNAKVPDALHGQEGKREDMIPVRILFALDAKELTCGQGLMGMSRNGGNIPRVVFQDHDTGGGRGTDPNPMLAFKGCHESESDRQDGDPLRQQQ